MLPVMKSLYKKVSLTIFLVGIVACVFGSYVVYYSGKQIVERSAGGSFYALAQLTSSKLELLIEHHLEEATIFARSRNVIEFVKQSNEFYSSLGDAESESRIRNMELDWVSDNMDKNKYLANPVSEFLRDYEKSTADFLAAYENPLNPLSQKEPLHKSILVTNNKGVIVAATQPSARFQYGNDREWERGFSYGDGKKTLSDIYYDEVYKSYVFIIQVPIQEFGADGGKTIGLIRMVHNAGPFFGWVTSIRMGKTDHTMLVSSDGTILFCPIFPIKTHKLDSGMSREIVLRKTGWISSTKDVHYFGSDSINGFAPVNISLDFTTGNFGGQQWFIFTSQNPKETFEPLYSFLRFVGAIGVIGVLTFTLFGLIASRRFVGPIIELKDGARRIGDGDYEHWINIHRNDEIGELAIEFNKMAKKLMLSYTGLEQLSKMKSEFVSKVSHELRTPLTSIKGFAEILLEHDDIEPATKKEFLGIINSESSRLARLINDVLDLSKIESGKFVWQIKVLNLRGILEFAVSLMKGFAREKNLRLFLEVEDDLPAVLGDRDQILQVLDNLIGNAVKFTRKGEVKLVIGRDGLSKVRVSVIDTGPGIASCDIANIFETFYQAGSTIKGESKGTGLGLSISREIVGYLGGEIWCESEVDKGSSFIFTLPVAKRGNKSTLIGEGG